MTTPNITTYGVPTNGGYRRSFEIVKGNSRVTVLVTPSGGEDAFAAEVTTLLADSGARMAAYVRRAELACAGAAEAERALRVAEAKIPPAVPSRLLAPGCVRMRDQKLFLLGNREKGWSSFGFMLDGWDDLFRRYNVRVTAHGTDQHGDYWTVI